MTYHKLVTLRCDFVARHTSNVRRGSSEPRIAKDVKGVGSKMSLLGV